MSKKKVVRKKAAKKKAAKPSKKKAAKTSKQASSKAAPKKTVSAKKKAAAKALSKKRTVVKKTKAAKALGRPRVAGTAELELMFRKDLEAREVFEFLGVKTLKELEQLSADEILERLTAPMVRTVGRIRKALAMNNRCLSGDEKFAVSFKKSLS